MMRPLTADEGVMIGAVTMAVGLWVSCATAAWCGGTQHTASSKQQLHPKLTFLAYGVCTRDRAGQHNGG
jgi:hypothetical protein